MRHTNHLESQARQRAETRLLEEVTRRVHAERTIASMKEGALQRDAFNHHGDGDTIVSITPPTVDNVLVDGTDAIYPHHSTLPAPVQPVIAGIANTELHHPHQDLPADETVALSDILHKAASKLCFPSLKFRDHVCRFF